MTARLMKGSTNHPVRRSSATEAKAAARSSSSRPSRAIRTTSPPTAAGNTLEMNWPARNSVKSRRNGTSKPNGRKTCAQRSVCRVYATSSVAPAAISHQAVDARHFGNRSSASKWGMRQIRTARKAMLTATRMASFHTGDIARRFGSRRKRGFGVSKYFL